jgi:hypothetical protein
VAWARITHQWDDDTTTEVEVGTDAAAHPDLLDELVQRVCVLWRETCCGADDE